VGASVWVEQTSTENNRGRQRTEAQLRASRVQPGLASLDISRREDALGGSIRVLTVSDLTMQNCRWKWVARLW